MRAWLRSSDIGADFEDVGPVRPEDCFPVPRVSVVRGGASGVAMIVAKKPHVSRIRAIHFRAPNRSMPALLGISKMAYPMKKIPAPNP